jgi:undecaprenyl-diphosphatase
VVKFAAAVSVFGARLGVAGRRQAIGCGAVHALLLTPLASALSYFQAVVLGALQGVSELFPISSLGHTVLFPTLFGWNKLVDAQSQKESFWLALIVMLHVGSALGLLAYYWRDWVQIVRAFFRTLATRRIETSTERLAWLIVVASIPAGILGLALEHELRTLTAKPEIAAIFLMVNGCILLAAERFRRRAEVRELAIREGAKPDGARRLDTLEYREAVVVGVMQSTALVAGISRDGVTMGAGLARGMDHSDSARFAFLLATPIILAAGIFKLPDLLGHSGNGIRGQALVACAVAAVVAVFTVAFLVRYFKTRTLIPFAVYCLLFGLAMVIYTQT